MRVLVFLSLVLSLHTLSSAMFISRRRCLAYPPLVCDLRPTASSRVSGRVVFTPVFSRSFSGRCGVRIRATVNFLTPGLHGFHIHSYGDQALPDGTSLGGHFTNPRMTEVDHGLPLDGVRHWGDFGNLEANAGGVAKYERVDKVIKMWGIVGRGMVVHEGEDKGGDFQPSGDAGGRVAVCAIGFANPDEI